MFHNKTESPERGFVDSVKNVFITAESYLV